MKIMKILFGNDYLNFVSTYDDKVNQIIGEYAGNGSIAINFTSKSDDKMAMFSSIFEESPFASNYPIRAIGYCERLIKKYNLTQEEQIACIFH